MPHAKFDRQFVPGRKTWFQWKRPRRLFGVIQPKYIQESEFFVFLWGAFLYTLGEMSYNAIKNDLEVIESIILRTLVVIAFACLIGLLTNPIIKGIAATAKRWRIYGKSSIIQPADKPIYLIAKLSYNDSGYFINSYAAFHAEKRHIMIEAEGFRLFIDRNEYEIKDLPQTKEFEIPFEKWNLQITLENQDEKKKSLQRLLEKKLGQEQLGPILTP